MAEQPRGAQSWWLTLPGILTAAATVITAITGLLLGLNQAGLLGGDHGSATTTTSAPTAPVSSTLSNTSAAAGLVAGMVGNWVGTAETSDGTTFQITLEVDRACELGQLCGSIGIPHIPCYGQVFLDSIDNGEVEFRVANFDERSDRETCQEGAGERFKLLSDGRLAYRTTYEPIAQGVLEKL